MSLRVSKPEFNIREKLNELDRPMGVQGNNILQSNTTAESFSKIQAGRRNLLINGDMTISQRGSSTTSITTDTFGACDRWEVDINSGGTWTQEQAGDAPYNTGFTHCTSLTCTTAHAMGGNPSFVQLRQKIEAGNTKSLMGGTPNAKPLTASFWVKSNEPGKYYVTIWRPRTSTTSSRMSISYTIEQSEVWEFKTITFPPDTMTGYQEVLNSTGLEIHFCLGKDQNNHGSAHYGHWNTNDAFIGKGQTNLAAATSNYWRMTGAQLEIGNEHTEFDQRSYIEEFGLCQRYYQKRQLLGNCSTGFSQSGGGYNSHLMNIPLPCKMRVIPTVTFDNGTQSACFQPGGDTANFGSFSNGHDFLSVTTGSTNSTWTTQVVSNGNPYVNIDAEM